MDLCSNEGFPATEAMGRAERGLLLLLLLLLLAQLPELLETRTRVKARTPMITPRTVDLFAGARRLRLALMRVRRLERFGLGPFFIAFAFYGGAGFVLGGREGARGCFSRAPRCDDANELSDVSGAVAGRRE
ncbi:hypothetical protein P8935_01235 [Telmatobacter sp. DSM 110680]|uniref:Uncharacterized protein n=1 Tax=Telmatobacter sp. DSM 110680 TaxID=3036704 RepID=A0AAU7DKY5_9BACT